MGRSLVVWCNILHNARSISEMASKCKMQSANYKSNNPGCSIECNSFKDRLMGTVASTVVICLPITTYMY